MSARTWVRLDPQDGTNCRSCSMTARDCRSHEPGEVGAVCCDRCDHPNAAGNECVGECLCEEVTGAVTGSQVQDGPGDPLAHLPLAERIAVRAADIAELAATVAGPGRAPADYVAAYGSLHEVVRAFLAGERSARYLRRLHAEIEAELTGGDRRG